MFSAFVSLIGLGIVWFIVFLYLGSLINTVRYKKGQSLNDSVTFFIQGFALGPAAIMAGFDPRNRANGKRGGLIAGGIVGTISYLVVYSIFF